MSAPRESTPSWASFAFTFVNSLGGGVITGSLYFMAENAYAMPAPARFGLGVLQGVTYILAAASAGRFMRWVRGRGVRTRTVLIGIMLLCALSCAVPWIAELSATHGARRATWPLWVLTGAYMPLTGLLWPLVESYVSGGLSGHRLRSTMGAWNVVWSSALVAAYLATAPFTGALAAKAIAMMGAAHLVALLLLVRFAKEPAPHIEGEHEPHPPVFERLLMSFRVLLPTSYLVSAALTPYLPSVMARLEIPDSVRTMVATSWLIPRVAAFAFLGFWGGWHGRWWPTVLGAGSLLAGFAMAVASPYAIEIWSLGGARTMLVVGLALFGVGMGIIYSGAISYAMEVGKAEVDAGGTHEALIGVGYVGGPAWGLVAAGTAHLGWISPASESWMLVVGVSVIGALVCAFVAWRAVSMSRISRDMR